MGARWAGAGVEGVLHSDTRNIINKVIIRVLVCVWASGRGHYLNSAIKRGDCKKCAQITLSCEPVAPLRSLRPPFTFYDNFTFTAAGLEGVGAISEAFVIRP